MTAPLSLRLTDAALQRLGERAARMGTRPRTLAQRYVEEGLRMDEHPLVRFVDGPAGRRARLVGTGKDVWEVVSVVRENDADVRAASEYLELPLGAVQAAATYYGASSDEIDGWSELNRRASEDARAAFEAGRASLHQ